MPLITLSGHLSHLLYFTYSLYLTLPYSGYSFFAYSVGLQLVAPGPLLGLELQHVTSACFRRSDVSSICFRISIFRLLLYVVVYKSTVATMYLSLNIEYLSLILILP